MNIREHDKIFLELCGLPEGKIMDELLDHDFATDKNISRASRFIENCMCGHLVNLGASKEWATGKAANFATSIVSEHLKSGGKIMGPVKLEKQFFIDDFGRFLQTVNLLVEQKRKIGKEGEEYHPVFPDPEALFSRKPIKMYSDEEFTNSKKLILEEIGLPQGQALCILVNHDYSVNPTFEDFKRTLRLCLFYHFRSLGFSVRTIINERCILGLQFNTLEILDFFAMDRTPKETEFKAIEVYSRALSFYRTRLIKQMCMNEMDTLAELQGNSNDDEQGEGEPERSEDPNTLEG